MIVPKFNFTKIKAQIEQAKTILDKKVLEALHRAGMEIVNYAKDHRVYNDQTGNLTNSIGFVVLKYGEEKSIFFEEKVRGLSSDKNGKAEGEKYARQLTSKYISERYTLLIVAGMQYASFVEDMEHKSVLEHSKQFAPEVLKQALKFVKKELANLPMDKF